MPTGQRLAILNTNSLVNRTKLKEWLLEYFEDAINETFAGLLQGGSGTLDSDKIGIAADGADKIQLNNLANANKVCVGGGQVLTLTASVAGVTSAIQFENTLGVTYHVGLSYAKVEASVGLNRKQRVEYTSYEDQIGRVGNADASPAPVDTPNTNLRLYIDGLCEAAEDHSGRKARVWLTTPVSADPDTAFVDVDIEYDGTNNYVDLPYSASAGPLGQDVSASAPSTTATDYKIWVKGPRVARTDFSADTTYAYLGTVIGVGAGVAPSVFDTSNQFPVFLFSLDRAYDGAGSGGGRIMHLDAGAIEKRMYTGTAFDPNLYVESWKDPDGNFAKHQSPWGFMSDCHRFADDFHYENSAWTWEHLSGNVPTYWYRPWLTSAASGFKMKPVETNPDLGNTSGVLEAYCDGSTTSSQGLVGPYMGVVNMLPAFRARIAVNQVSDQEIFIGFSRAANLGDTFGILIDDSDIKGRTKESAGPTTTDTASMGTLVADTMYWVFAYVYADPASATNYSVAFWFDGMAGPALVLDSPYDFSTNNYETWLPEIRMDVKVGGVHARVVLWIDYWEYWTRGAVLGL